MSQQNGDKARFDRQRKKQSLHRKRIRELLTEILPKCVELQDFEVEHDFLGIGQRTMLLNAKKLDSNSLNVEMILLAIEDTTARKRAEAKQFNLELELRKANEALRALVL